MRRPLVRLALAGILLSASCTKIYTGDESRDCKKHPDCGTTPANPTSPTPPVPIGQTVISYRVIGLATHATITFVSSVEGTQVVSTQLPWVTQFTTSQTSVFVFISAMAENGGSVIVQVYVNGEFFREASSDPLVLGSVATVSASINLGS